MRRLLMLALAMVVAGVALPADAKNYGVSARDSHFLKAFVVVRVGDTVTWRNTGDLEHTVTSFPDSPKSFSSSSSRQCVPNPIIGNDPDDCMDPGDTFTVRFQKPGTYDYFCKVHGSTARRPDNQQAASDQPCDMCGRIVVKAATTVPPTTGPSSSPTASPPAGSASPSADPSASPSPSVSPSGSADPGGPGTVASGGSGGGGGGLGRGGVALLGITILGGAGWWTWRRYLAPS